MGSMPAASSGKWDDWDATMARVTRERTYRLIAGLPDFPEIRDAFERAFSDDASVAPELMRLVGHRDDAVAYTAAPLLGRFPSQAASSLLKHTYETEERLAVRIRALSGLVRMGDPAAPTLAIAALSSEVPGMPGAGIGALEPLGDSANSQALLGFLDQHADSMDPDWLEILGRLGDPPGSTAVRDRLLAEAVNKRRHFDVRVGAARGLEKMGLGGLEPAHRILDLKRADATAQSLIVVEGEVSDLAAKRFDTIRSQTAVEALLRDADLGPHRVDEWGRLVRVKYVSEGVFDVISDGPDSAPETTDDISLAEPFRAYRTRVFGDLF
jgi:hypothetical protein